MADNDSHADEDTVIGKSRLTEIWALLEYVDSKILKWSAVFPGSPSLYAISEYVVNHIEKARHWHIRRHLKNLVAEQAAYDAINFEKLR